MQTIHFVTFIKHIIPKNVHIDGKFCGRGKLCPRYVGTIFDIPGKYELIWAKVEWYKGRKSRRIWI